MSIVRNNLLANYAGSIWTGVMSLVFIPIYVRLIGIEAYGLVGFYLTLQSAFSILDLGLSTTLNREFARLSALEGQAAQQRTLLRTIECIYWAIALLNGALVIAFARPIAELWINAERLPTETIAGAVMMMGVVLLFQWPLGMYSGGLLGLQRQISLNKINATMATLRGVGAIAALRFVGPTVMVFFGWQVLISAVHTAAVGWMLWRALGGGAASRFDRTVLTPIWQFAAGMAAISVVATVITQIDKLVVSKLLPLSTLGYYAIAGTVAMSIYRIITPFFTTLFPRFSQLAAAGDVPALTTMYHRSCQALAVAVLPAAVFIACFSREILYLWTRDAVTSGETHVILSVLVIGTAMNGVMAVPYALQLAYGWTRLTILFNVVGVLVLVPGVYVLTRKYGAVGASFGWMAYNTAGAGIVPLLMHRRLLKGEQHRFYLADVGPPFAAAVLAAVALRLVINGGLPTGQLVVALMGSAAIVQASSIAAAPQIRSGALSLVRRLRA